MTFRSTIRIRLGRPTVRGLATAIAVASAGSGVHAQVPAPQRAAILLQPIPLDHPPIARGAIDDPGTPLTSTPVIRNTAPAGSLPSWLINSDPNVTPAVNSWTTPGDPIRPVNSSAPATDAASPGVSSTSPKGLGRIKGLATGNEKPVSPPAARETPTRATPFQGMGPNGAPVYAGPPAYGWYGYGTTTPGANPLAPTGQYPRASADWYSLTGATPGAVPVPVTSSSRTATGSEPPAYLAAEEPVTPQTTAKPIVVDAGTSVRPFAPAAAPPAPKPLPPAAPLSALPAIQPPKFNPAPAPASLQTKFSPASGVTPVPKLEPVTPVAPRILPVPLTKPVPAPAAKVPPGPDMPLMPVGVPAIVPLPSVTPSAATSQTSQVPVKRSDPLPVVAIPRTPALLPASLTTPPTGEANWQPTSGKVLPLGEETWLPSPESKPTPEAQSSLNPEPREVDNTAVSRVRGQAPDPATPADPIGDLIRTLCKGVVKEVDVRWTGSRRVQVCFEATSERVAATMVKLISGRPELTQFQIDFCVLVK